MTCIRGCRSGGQHHTDCPDTTTCPGCAPRPATHGHLCGTCHYRLAEWLSGGMPPTDWHTLPVDQRTGTFPDSLLWARWCLDHACTPSGAASTSIDPGTPLNIAAVALITQIDDQVSSWLELWCDERNLHGPDTYHLDTACAYLAGWLDQIEQQPWVGDMWDELSLLMIRAHGIAPWRPAATRLPGAACPDCLRTSLVHYGGDEVVTCQTCRTLWPMSMMTSLEQPDAGVA